MTEAYRGVFPIAPTPFDTKGGLDLDGQKRVLDCMIDQGVDGICILANFSEQFLLTDEERDVLLDLCLSHLAGRVPVIVTCSHFATQIAAARAKRAAEAGAAMLMLMPPYHGATLRAGDSAILEHFAAVADAAGIPIMIQDAPLERCRVVRSTAGEVGARNSARQLFERSKALWRLRSCAHLSKPAAMPSRDRSTERNPSR